MNLSVTITDEDAIAALDAEIARIAAAGTDYTREEYLSDFVTTQHRNLREPQLRQAALAKVEDDPPLKALLDKKRAAREAEEAAKVVAEAKR